MRGPDPLIDKIIELKQQLRDLFIQHYLQRELFTWVWWIGIACVIIPFVIWWKVVDKKRLLEICLFGLIVNVSAVFVDITGSEFVWWEYPVHLLPQIPVLFPIDFIIVPTVFMIIYQKCPGWWKFLLVSTISGAALAFLIEPLAIWIGQYKLITWKLIYSFPLYIAIACFSRIVTTRLLAAQAKAGL